MSTLQFCASSFIRNISQSASARYARDNINVEESRIRVDVLKEHLAETEEEREMLLKCIQEEEDVIKEYAVEQPECSEHLTIEASPVVAHVQPEVIVVGIPEPKPGEHLLVSDAHLTITPIHPVGSPVKIPATTRAKK